MKRLVILAVAIDDVRDIFGADEALAERLRATAAARFGRPAPARKRWFGPLMRRDPDTEVDANRPLSTDVDALLAGGHVPPDRMAPCWDLLIAWMEDLSAIRREVGWDPAAFERIEWDLARAGLNSDYSLRSLADRQLGAPLRPLPGQVAGYAKHVHVVDALAELRAARAHPELTDETAAFLAPILEVLAVVADDPRLDVVVVGAG